jgi:ferredoxin
MGYSAMSGKEELETLKARARIIEDRLRSLEKRIQEIESVSTSSGFIALVNPDRCVACGTCQDSCPTGAISIDEIACVDPKRCIGCGRCVDQCPRGALSLHPVDRGFREKNRAASGRR